ncbi:MAG: radical SAM protein [Patescibacteria group bacterium]|jgi:anaerobic magnesium-protoporphyrin IX monomethyl ester cyclase|nr:radical SAM protein [Patescibacteria group bacterium]
MKTLNILFVKPLVKFPVGDKQEIGIPLSYLNLGQYLKENSNHNFEILDYRLQALETGTTNINPEDDFRNFDVIAIGSSSSDFPETVRLFKIAKQLGKITILGGIFPTQNRDYCLGHSSVDYLVSGEGEISFINLLNAFSIRKIDSVYLGNIPGVSFINDQGEIIHNKKQQLLCVLPEINVQTYEKLPLDVYRKYTNAHVMCSRGCPFACSFCSVSKFWERKYRTRPVENIVKEMRFLKERGFKRVHLKDETLTVKDSYSLNLFQAIGEEGLGLGIKLKSRIDGIVDNKLLETMIFAGVDYIHFGVETVSDKLLKKIDKGGKVNSAMIAKVLNNVLEHGLKINPIFIIGIPGQTIEDLEITLQFLESLGTYPQTVVYGTFWTPHPQDGIFPLESGNELFVNDLNRFTHKQPVACPESLTREQLIWGFDQLAIRTGNRNVNPLLDPEYKERFIANEVINDIKVPICI